MPWPCLLLLQGGCLLYATDCDHTLFPVSGLSSARAGPLSATAKAWCRRTLGRFCRPSWMAWRMRQRVCAMQRWQLAAQPSSSMPRWVLQTTCELAFKLLC